MNHYNWTYVAGGGRNYPVGLLHSSKSGHLIIYVGSKIMAIDFKVLDTKEYTFFIEDELCHIQLERRGEEMYYFFNIDRKADTPRNRARNAMEKKFAKQMALALGVLVVLVTAFVLWSNSVKKSPYIKAEELLVKQGRETVGKVFIKNGEAEPAISYQFVANSQGYTAPSNLLTRPLILLKNGMPLEQGDEFVVRYVPSRPEINKMLFDRPTERQIAIYQQRASKKHAALHPDDAPTFIDCMVNAAYQIGGIGGLADFYFQDLLPAENPEHNQTTYLRLTRDLPFKKKVERDCW